MPSVHTSGARKTAPLLATLHYPARLVTQTSFLPRSPRAMLMFAVAIAAAPLLMLIYAYAAYPAILWTIARIRPMRSAGPGEFRCPSVTITVPVFNAASTISGTLDSLLDLDYPRNLEILVISDASDDGTEDIVRSYAERGIRLLRLPRRVGKTAAENAALAVAVGEIIVNVDATVSVPSGSLRPLIRAFDDPTVGVASGRDVSVGSAKIESTGGESAYVGYEMWVRDLETRTGTIVGASGCFYGVRRSIHAKALPPELSWDFASALVSRQQGYRTVSVPAAICLVPRTAHVRNEGNRKVRTMARGLSTLFYYRSLMNPFRYGAFALKLISHKLLRWLPYLLAPFALLALVALAAQSEVARLITALLLLTLTCGIVGIRSTRSEPSKPIALAGFAVAVFVAGSLAWWEALRRTEMATWEPTRRPRTELST